LQGGDRAHALRAVHYACTFADEDATGATRAADGLFANAFGEDRDSVVEVPELLGVGAQRGGDAFVNVGVAFKATQVFVGEGLTVLRPAGNVANVNLAVIGVIGFINMAVILQHYLDRDGFPKGLSSNRGVQLALALNLE
jgi:hypothetical protein